MPPLTPAIQQPAGLPVPHVESDMQLNIRCAVSPRTWAPVRAPARADLFDASMLLHWWRWVLKVKISSRECAIATACDVSRPVSTRWSRRFHGSRLPGLVPPLIQSQRTMNQLKSSFRSRQQGWGWPAQRVGRGCGVQGGGGTASTCSGVLPVQTAAQSRERTTCMLHEGSRGSCSSLGAWVWYNHFNLLRCVVAAQCGLVGVCRAYARQACSCPVCRFLSVEGTLPSFLLARCRRPVQQLH
jgi:hypothetical protein